MLKTIYLCAMLLPFAVEGQLIKTVPLSSLKYKIIGKDSLERAMFASSLDNQSFLLTCFSYANDRSGDITLIKIKKDLSVAWEKSIGISGFDFAFVTSTISDGNFLLTGFTSGKGSGGLDAYVLKINQQGDTLWTSTLGGSGDDRAYRAIETKDKHYVVIGQTTSWGKGSIDGLLYKLDASGKLLWQKTLGSELLDRTFSVTELSNGDFIVAGNTNANYPENSDILIFRASSTGEAIWEKKIVSPRGDVSHAMIQKDKNSLLSIGYTAEFSFPLSDPLVVHFDHAGEVLGKYTLKTGTDLRLMDGYISSSGKLMAAGFVRDDASAKWDPLVAELNFSNSEFTLTRILAGEENDEVYHLVPMDNKKILLVGHSHSSSNKKGDIMLIEFKRR